VLSRFATNYPSGSKQGSESVRFGLKADMTVYLRDARFTSESEIPGGDQHVCFVPIADITVLK
jgi:hypothetical protein